MTQKLLAGFLIALGLLTPACAKDRNKTLPGYVEGQFVYVASAIAGRMDSVEVQKGRQVKAGQSLFVLEHTYETEAVQNASALLVKARNELADQEKGDRPDEIREIEAQLEKARAAARLSKVQLERREVLIKHHDIAQEDLDTYRAQHQSDKADVAELEAKLAQSRLGARPDAIKAAQNAVEAAEATLEQARWELSQKRPVALFNALVFDTPHMPGDWVSAGSPGVVLLPPENVKVRFFIPEDRLGEIKTGQAVTVTCDGCPGPFSGQINYISPRAEYTPPVIYSDSFRARLVFMAEAVFPPDQAKKLHPGQPVDVAL